MSDLHKKLVKGALKRRLSNSALINHELLSSGDFSVSSWESFFDERQEWEINPSDHTFVEKRTSKKNLEHHDDKNHHLESFVPDAHGSLNSVPHSTINNDNDITSQNNNNNNNNSNNSNNQTTNTTTSPQSTEEIRNPKHNHFEVFSKGTSGVTFFFLHGGGHSALSWARMVSEMTMQKKPSESFRVLALNLRAHGLTQTINDDDMAIETLVQDVSDTLGAIFPRNDPETLKQKIVIVGHSMGGAVAAKSAYAKCHPQIVGTVIMDVVEGTALEALGSMHAILERRPRSFPSQESAIEWAVTSRTLQHIESAKISIPPQIIKGSNESWTWRTKLAETEKFWKGWFTGLSSNFLSAPCAKLLILAGTDRLDKDLTIGQMQGKFQLILLPACGHVVQEDDPHRTAGALLSFARRNRWL